MNIPHTHIYIYVNLQCKEDSSSSEESKDEISNSLYQDKISATPIPESDRIQADLTR